MRLAIILFGLSYDEKYFKKQKKEFFFIDYRKSIENYKKYIFKYYKKLGYKVDIFFCTNNSKKEKDILNDFKPKSYLFVDDSSKSNLRYGCRNNKIINAVNLCMEYSKNNNVVYDNVLITRFDLKFKKEFNNIKFKNNKFNCSFVLDKKIKEKICDNFYFLPFNMLERFYNLLIISENKSSHNILYLLRKKIKEIHFLFNKQKSIIDNEFYKIVRKKVGN